MKIKSINIQNNKILGNLFLDFTNDSGEIINSIIIAGENGTGKSTILNIIYEFSQLNLVSTASSEKREFVVQFSEEEIAQLKQNDEIKRYIGSDIKDREFIFKFDFSIINNCEYSVHIMQLFRTFSAGHPEIRCSDSGCQCSPL